MVMVKIEGQNRRRNRICLPNSPLYDTPKEEDSNDVSMLTSSYLFESAAGKMLCLANVCNYITYYCIIRIIVPSQDCQP